jgi:hypothetical protein
LRRGESVVEAKWTVRNSREKTTATREMIPPPTANSRFDVRAASTCGPDSIPAAKTAAPTAPAT